MAFSGYAVGDQSLMPTASAQEADAETVRVVSSWVTQRTVMNDLFGAVEHRLCGIFGDIPPILGGITGIAPKFDTLN